MRLVWTESTHADLLRLYARLAAVNQRARSNVVQALAKSPTFLRADSRASEQLFQFAPRKAHQLMVRAYELQYQLTGDRVVVLGV